ncbi:MAG: hypothetical protein M3N47_10650 [Chloroflexota bacterium]|nr:hypothetical protein [Chloroflexota bacterium]
MTPDTIVVDGVCVASAVPGRIRLRATGAEGRRSLASVAGELADSAGVTAVDVRLRSASVVVRFDPQKEGEITDRLVALGVDLRGGVAVAPAGGPGGAVAAAVASANRAVAGRLDGTDLGVLVPLGLGVLAARRAMRGEERLADAPWYVLAWYASETFWRFHGGGTPARGDVADSEGE